MRCFAVECSVTSGRSTRICPLTETYSTTVGAAICATAIEKALGCWNRRSCRCGRLDTWSSKVLFSGDAKSNCCNKSWGLWLRPNAAPGCFCRSNPKTAGCYITWVIVEWDLVVGSCFCFLPYLSYWVCVFSIGSLPRFASFSSSWCSLVFTTFLPEKTTLNRLIASSGAGFMSTEIVCCLFCQTDSRVSSAWACLWIA